VLSEGGMRATTQRPLSWPRRNRATAFHIDVPANQSVPTIVGKVGKTALEAIVR